MQFINMDRLVTSLTNSYSNQALNTPITKKTLKCANKQNVKITKLFRPEYTSTPNYTLPKTSTPVLLRKNFGVSSIPIIEIATTKKSMFRNYCVNSTFKEDASVSPKLIAKKLFRDKQTDMVLVKRPKKSLTVRCVNNQQKSKRALSQRIKKNSDYSQSMSFIKKNQDLILKLGSSKKYSSTSGCTKCHRVPKDFYTEKRLGGVETWQSEGVLNQLLYKPYPTPYTKDDWRSTQHHHLRPILSCQGQKNNKLIQLENINFNFFSNCS